MTFLRTSLFSVAALAVAVLAPRHAAAQSASYCGGKIVSDAFYSTISSTGASSRADYWMQLRNTTNANVNYAIQFAYGAKPVTDKVTPSVRTLKMYGSERIKLALQTFANPAGNGALDAYALKGYTAIACR